MQNLLKHGDKLLVHTCCAPCSTSVYENLINNFKIEGFFFNPNIHPIEEYAGRRDELIKFAKIKAYTIHIQEEPLENWFNEVKGLEQEIEGGRRCEVCFRYRLDKTAKFAVENKFDGFTTVLTVSPHKNSAVINKIGKELEEKYGICFLESDFKKNNGFKRSLELSKEFNLYRQSFCGCSFSVRTVCKK